MKSWRKRNKVTLEQLSSESGVSRDLIGMVENGEVTHPNIAKKIARVYGLSEIESYELMPDIHRPNSPNYDPKRYVEEVPDSRTSVAGERRLY